MLNRPEFDIEADEKQCFLIIFAIIIAASLSLIGLVTVIDWIMDMWRFYDGLS